MMTEVRSDNSATSNGDAAPSNPDILANLALANQIFNANLAQQNAIQNQQAIFYLQLATVAKSIELVLAIDPTDPGAADKLKMCRDLIESFRISQT
jgi:hypothetical protein